MFVCVCVCFRYMYVCNISHFQCFWNIHTRWVELLHTVVNIIYELLYRQHFNEPLRTANRCCPARSNIQNTKKPFHKYQSNNQHVCISYIILGGVHANLFTLYITKHIQNKQYLKYYTYWIITYQVHEYSHFKTNLWKS